MIMVIFVLALLFSIFILCDLYAAECYTFFFLFLLFVTVVSVALGYALVFAK